VVDRTDRLFDPQEALPADRRLSRQLARLQEVLSQTGAPAARERARAAGLLDGEPSLDRLRRVPVLRKEDLPRVQAQRWPLGGWVWWDRVRRLFVSPGPIYDPEGPGPDYWGCAPALHAAGFRAGDVVLNTFSYHLTPAAWMMEGGLQVLGAVVVPGGVGNTEIQARAASQLRATGYTGTPSFLATLLQRMDELGLPAHFQVALVTAEPLPASLRARFETRGIRTQQAYGTADVGIVAYECPCKDGMHLADRCLVELLDPHTGQPVPPGQPGEVVVTLLDPTYPLLRLATGDVSVLVEAPCACGRTSPRLAGVLGRVSEAVKVRGVFVHPGQLREAAARHPEVRRFQFVVRRAGDRDEFVARVEADARDPDLAGRFAETVQALTTLRAQVEILPPGALGEVDRVLVDERRWD
jgi:phenylacetate-CoA ligase